MPPARAWVADRPGDVRARAAAGTAHRHAGPERRLRAVARRAGPATGSGSSRASTSDDAVAVVAELAMKRAATFGRAPTILDVDFAIELLGYAGAAPEDVRRWRPGVVRGADHDYVVRRAIADTVSSSLLRLIAAGAAGAAGRGARRRCRAEAAEPTTRTADGSASDVDRGEDGDVDAAPRARAAASPTQERE